MALDDIQVIENNRPYDAAKISAGLMVFATVVGAGVSSVVCEGVSCVAMGSVIPPMIVLALTPIIYYSSFEKLDPSSFPLCESD